MTSQTRFYIPVLLAALSLGGCTKLGPDFVRPDAPTENDWSYQDSEVLSQPVELTDWWTVFNDPVLNHLVSMAYQQNLPLQVAGLRIYEARAQLGIAVGLQYPQQQQAGGSATTNRLSENSPNFFPIGDKNFKNYQAGFDAAWELDFWGRSAVVSRPRMPAWQARWRTMTMRWSA